MWNVKTLIVSIVILMISNVLIARMDSMYSMEDALNHVEIAMLSKSIRIIMSIAITFM